MDPDWDEAAELDAEIGELYDRCEALEARCKELEAAARAVVSSAYIYTGNGGNIAIVGDALIHRLAHYVGEEE